MPSNNHFDIFRIIINNFRQYFIPALLIMLSLLSIQCGETGDKEGDGMPVRSTVALIPKGATHEHWKSVHLGAQHAAQEFDIDIIWKGPIKEDDREEQLQIYETLTGSKVSAICIAPIDDRVFIRPVKDALAQGIPTVVFDSALQDSAHISFVSTDNYRGGVLGAQRIAELIGGTGKLIMMRYQEGSAATAYREQGFLDTIREYPDIEMLSDNQYSGATTESAYQTSENLLNRFSEFDAIWTPNESSTFGCLRALQERDLAGKVVFVGFDTSIKLVKAMRANEIHGLSLQNPFNMGYLSVKTAVQFINGEKIERMIDTGVVMATPDNMNEPEIKSLLLHDFSAFMK
ncbi:substrate-binding domain-containing protein [Candidatus Latescibacterota bacterium]